MNSLLMTASAVAALAASGMTLANLQADAPTPTHSAHTPTPKSAAFADPDLMFEMRAHWAPDGSIHMACDVAHGSSPLDDLQPAQIAKASPATPLARSESAPRAKAASRALLLNQPLSITVNAADADNSVYLDIPAGAERLALRLDAANLDQDLDLLVRFDSPFPTSAGDTIDYDWLMSHAHYVSIGARGDEAIVITPAGHQPLRAGRLHFALVSYSGQPAAATLRANLEAGSEFVPIEMVFDSTANGCNVSGWSDGTPQAAIGGNNGTSLGQQRRMAAQEAARILSDELRPNTKIRIQACWDELGEGTLAQAGPSFVFVHDPGSGRDAAFIGDHHLVQFGTPAAHQAGTEVCRLTGNDCRTPPADVRATFNLGVDSQALVNRRFDYGFTHSGSTSKPSFLSVAMHEIAHGLGFVGSTETRSDVSAPLGSQRSYFGQPYDDAYGNLSRYRLGSNSREFLRLTNAERIEALTSSINLAFAGPNTINDEQNAFRTSSGAFAFVPLHAPPTISAGSTYSHFSSGTHNPMPQLMSAQIHFSAPRSLGLARALLEDIGYSRTPKATPATINPLQSQYFDVARNGHGFEIRKIDGIPGIDDLYFVILYSYDSAGRPQFFNAVGRIVDGVFLPERNEFGDSLVQTRYLGPGQTVADSNPAFQGEVRIDFVDATRHPVCQDGAARADDNVAILSWTLDGQRRQWCVQPLLDSSEGIAIDYSNQWWNPADPGWGMSVLSFPGSGGDGIGLQLYFPDAAGNGRWALVQTTSFASGGTYPVQQPTGYCRSCASAELQFTQIGTMTINMSPSGQSTVSVDITYNGPEGGRFVRTNVPIVPVGTPALRGN